MSTLPEAKLAREAEICYSVICMSTDYDCWKEDEAHVTVDMVVQTMKSNIARARSLIEAVLSEPAGERTCSCGDSTRNAVMTAPDARDTETGKKLKVILPDYF
jgi:5'-methylthioadenosine phosphorylase